VTTKTEPATQPLTRLADDERLFRDSVYEFADREIRPHVREMDEHTKIPRELIDKLFDLGVMGIEIPESFGGGGASFFHAVLAVEALSRVDPSMGVLVDVQNTLVINALLRWGSEDIKRRYLPKVAAKMVGAYALSEAGSGSDAFAMATRATESGDGFALTGRKLWITNGDEADLFIVFANANPEAGYRGITAFLVERGFDGFTVGKKEDKLGIRASSTCELLFENCRVPRSNVLGEVGKGYKVAIETLNEGRIGIGAQMLGLTQAALDHAIKYTRDRRVPGGAAPACARRDRARSSAAPGLQRRAAARRRPALPDRSGDVQDFLVGGGGARHVAGREPVRRLRLRQGLSRREAVSRRQDRPDLRRHVQPATADDCQTDTGMKLVSW
jgi:alkylation response protein AidB-like acyl-CoA dehydrogenase